MNQSKPISQGAKDFYSQNVGNILDPKVAAEKEINEIQALLKSQEQNDHARMPERVFRFVFLPLFAGDQDWPYKGKANLAMWINFAGNSFKPVDVIDTQGNVLFTVPAISDRTGVSPVKNDPNVMNSRIRSVVKNAEMLSHVSPRDGQRYLADQLMRRTMIQQNIPTILSNVKIWNDIFKRYGRPPILELEENTQTPNDVEGQTNTSQTQGLDEGDWEPA